MAKIGRNQTCPCGSGSKYKNCCAAKDAQEFSRLLEQQAKVTLKSVIEKLQQAAAEKETVFFEVGVFIFFSNSDGDAWLLETTQSDAVQVARGGNILDLSVEENEETIEMDWSHTFAIREKELYMTGYKDKQEFRLENVPTQQVNAAVRRVKKQYSQDLLEQVHVTLEND